MRKINVAIVLPLAVVGAALLAPHWVLTTAVEIAAPADRVWAILVDTG